MNNLFDVIDYIIKYENDNDRFVNNLKLQKLLYFIQVWFLLQTGEVCFHDNIEAWDFGMVVPRAYKKFARWGAMDLLPDFYDDRQLETIAINLVRTDLINAVLECFGDWSDIDMLNLIHKTKPYRLAHNRFDQKVYIQDILNYYKED